jgi:hypothetical protein
LRKGGLSAGIENFIKNPAKIVITKKLRIDLSAKQQLGILFVEEFFEPI